MTVFVASLAHPFLTVAACTALGAVVAVVVALARKEKSAC